MTHALQGLSNFTARLTLEDVPATVIARAKLQVLDALTTAVAPARTAPGKIVAHALDTVNEGKAAHVAATGAAVSVNTAAFVNTQMSVALDLGSNLFFSQGLGGLTVFGALALAESAGASGAKLLEAVIAGFEVAGRVALSFPGGYRVEAMRVVGEPPGVAQRLVVLGAAAANARMRALDAERTAHALALVAASVPLRQFARWRSGNEIPMAKFGLCGNMSVSAVAGTLLAERGFTGDLQILDDVDGFHRGLGSECADHSAMTRAFGERWLITEANFKRYPSATHNQQAIHTVEALMRKYRINPDCICAIHVGRAIGTSGSTTNVAPGNEVAAQFSLPFALAAMALGVPPREWDAKLMDQRVRALAARVQLVADATAVNEFAACTPEVRRSAWLPRSHVRIETTDGCFEAWSNYGEVSERECTDKFRHHCEEILSDQQITKIVDTVVQLEHLPDVRQLMGYFEPEAGD